MMRLVGLLTMLTVLAAPRAGAAPITLQASGSSLPMRVTVDGNRVLWNWQTGKVRVEGHVRVTLANSGYLTALPMVATEALELDTRNGILLNCEDGTLIAGPGLVAGKRILLSGAERTFRVEDAQGYVTLDRPDIPGVTSEPTVYFRAGEAGRRQDRGVEYLYILRGAVTTCDREKPHWEVTAKEMRYNTRTQELMVSGASAMLYGLRLPALPRHTFNFAASESSPWLPSLGYSGREGVFLGFGFDLTGADAAWHVTTALRLSSREAITGRLAAERVDGPRNYLAVLSRKEWVRDDTTNNLALDRLPELSVTQSFTSQANSSNVLSGALIAGSYRERVVDVATGSGTPADRDTVSDSRLRGALRWVHDPAAEKSRRGMWYGASAVGSAYADGERYGDLELFAGFGGYLNGDISGWANYRHHLTTGTTPFLFDDVDIERELQGGLRVELGGRWALRTWGRYDLDMREFADYEVAVSRQFHCLNWGVYYRLVGNEIGVSADLMGFTGGTDPYPAKSSFQKEMEAKGFHTRTTPELQIEPTPREDFPQAPVESTEPGSNPDGNTAKTDPAPAGGPEAGQGR